MEEQDEYEAWLAEQVAANQPNKQADDEFDVEEDVFAEIDAMEKAMAEEEANASQEEGDLVIDEPAEENQQESFTNPFEESSADEANEPAPESSAKRKHSENEAVEHAAKRTRMDIEDFLPKPTKILRVPPLDSDFVRLCSEEGETRYVRKVPHYTHKIACSDMNLLGESMFELKLKADDLREEMEMHALKIKSLSASSGARSNQGQTTEWTSTYRAKKYTELLSDEYINRTIIKWLKKWDPCVFNKKSAIAKKKEEAQKKMTEDEKKKKRFKQAWSENMAEEIDEEDPLDRPKMKILMLCGAPGLGKTTLAFVAAKHCGYK